MTVQTTRMTVVGHRDRGEVARPARPDPADARSVTIASPRGPRRRGRRLSRRAVLGVAAVVALLCVLVGGGSVLGRVADDTGVRMAKSSSTSDLVLMRRAEIRDALSHRYYRSLTPTQLTAATADPRLEGMPAALDEPGTRYLSRSERAAWVHGVAEGRPAPEGVLRVVDGVRAAVITPRVLAGGAGRQVRDLAADLGRRGAQVLVLDLRGVSGQDRTGPRLAPVTEPAAVDAAVEAAGAVLPARSPAAVGRTVADPVLRTTEGAPALPTVPVVVLVDHGTAGPAEILAAALRDAHRARLVGTTTAGDGLVRDEVRLADGGSLVLATAEYGTPGGAPIERLGLRPDVVVPRGSPDADLATAVAAAR